jgi:hypothetical protein
MSAFGAKRHRPKAPTFWRGGIRILTPHLRSHKPSPRNHVPSGSGSAAVGRDVVSVMPKLRVSWAPAAARILAVANEVPASKKAAAIAIPGNLATGVSPSAPPVKITQGCTELFHSIFGS